MSISSVVTGSPVGQKSPSPTPASPVSGSAGQGLTQKNGTPTWIPIPMPVGAPMGNIIPTPTATGQVIYNIPVVSSGAIGGMYNVTISTSGNNVPINITSNGSSWNYSVGAGIDSLVKPVDEKQQKIDAYDRAMGVIGK